MIALVVLLVWVLLSLAVSTFWVRAARHVPACEPAPIRVPEGSVLHVR